MTHCHWYYILISRFDTMLVLAIMITADGTTISVLDFISSAEGPRHRHQSFCYQRTKLRYQSQLSWCLSTKWQMKVGLATVQPATYHSLSWFLQRKINSCKWISTASHSFIGNISVTCYSIGHKPEHQNWLLSGKRPVGHVVVLRLSWKLLTVSL